MFYFAYFAYITDSLNMEINIEQKELGGRGKWKKKIGARDGLDKLKKFNWDFVYILRRLLSLLMK